MQMQHVVWCVQVDNTTFATVLELCEGGDLEGHLQQFHVSFASSQPFCSAHIHSRLFYMSAIWSIVAC